MVIFIVPKVVLRVPGLHPEASGLNVVRLEPSGYRARCRLNFLPQE